jgi:hypothetical protein
VHFKRARMLGLFVARQLAARHRIRVHLRRSRYAGVTAPMLLPTDLVEPSDPLAAPMGVQAKVTLPRPKGRRGVPSP